MGGGGGVGGGGGGESATNDNGPNSACPGHRNRQRPVPVPVTGVALQQLALNVHVKHSDLICHIQNKKKLIV